MPLERNRRLGFAGEKAMLSPERAKETGRNSEGDSGRTAYPLPNANVPPGRSNEYTETGNSENVRV
jgi:hypothetical protein